MKDIDFDELDRAVNSLMSPTATPSEEPAVSAPAENEGTPAGAEMDAPINLDIPSVSSMEDAAEQVLEAPQTPQVSELPVPDTTIASEDDLLQTHEPQASSAPVVRRGRFMDVMRPSSQDAKKMGPVSRQGVTLQPSSEALQADTKEATPVDETPLEQFDAVEDSAADATSFGTRMNDELSANTDSSMPAEDESTDDMPPLSSPFLPDAKVEKRPLGRPADVSGGASETAAEVAAEPPATPIDMTDSISSDKDAQLPEQPLPPELGSELLSIETSTEGLPAEPTPITPEELPKQEAPAPEPAQVTAPAGPAIVSASIPQQYKVEAPSGQGAPVNPIYDAQPLAHPAEKTPGWMWIVGILAVLLIGVGGGAAIYYLGLL